MIPECCHLWSSQDLQLKDLHTNLKKVKSYDEDSHLIRRLLQCKQCGQLYFYEFLEEVDLLGGNDPQYITYVPVGTEEEGDSLQEKDEFGLLSCLPQIRIDFSKETGALSIRWIGR